MLLKSYQTTILSELSAYLSVLKEKRDRYESLKNNSDELVRELAGNYHFAKEAWGVFSALPHHDKRDGLGDPLPDVYIKVPTGGGKTLLAVHAIEAIRQEYLQRQSGVTLWIVPSDTIYRQTLRALKDRTHPYRQVLDVASGGRVRVCERDEVFTPLECENQHVILLLMLQAGNRKDTESLRLFRDSGGFDAFFPPEDNMDEHRELLNGTANLDCFDGGGGLLPRQVKTSLGNVLRLQRPLIVVDEGQKAYSDLARQTLTGFNPSFVLELSATPPPQSNVLANVGGRALDNEGMIKLPINLINQTVPDWHSALLAAVGKRAELEGAADILAQNQGRYIRPIALIQVERTGKEQRDGNFIHSEDVREFLIKSCDVARHDIAVKSAETDELGDVDLLSPDCSVRFIITKQALQEGWDCSFAYVLAVLSNLGSITAMQQLVGRVLRQPDARKTGVKRLDECYVFTNRDATGEVAKMIKKGLEQEGLKDLSHCVSDVSNRQQNNTAGLKTAKTARDFERFEGRVYLPQFVVVQGKNKNPRPLHYEGDILAHLDWDSLNAPDMAGINLADTAHDTAQTRIGLNDMADGDGWDESFAGIRADPVLMARQLMDVVPNPWHAYAKTVDILKTLTERETARGTVNGVTPQARIDLNFVFIINEAKKYLAIARDKMAKDYFYQQMETGRFALVLFCGDSPDFRLPKKVQVRSVRTMTRADGGSLKRSLFDYVPDEDMNELEREVALYLDEQEQLLWWYRNQVFNGYALQGWQPNKIYPDLIAATKADGADVNGDGKAGADKGGKAGKAKGGAGKAGKNGQIREVLVMELKGSHLQGNTDTTYKKTVLDLCNDLCDASKNAKLQQWGELSKGFYNHQFRFQMVEQDDWANTINALLGGTSLNRKQ